MRCDPCWPCDFSEKKSRHGFEPSKKVPFDILCRTVLLPALSAIVILVPDSKSWSFKMKTGNKEEINRINFITTNYMHVA